MVRSQTICQIWKTDTFFSETWKKLEVKTKTSHDVEKIQFRCIVLKPGRQHVSTHGYTVMEQPVARDLLQSLAAGIMLVEPQQSSDNSLCSHPAASNTSQAGIIYHTNSKKDKFWLQTRSQSLVPKMKPFLASPNETIEAAFQKLKLKMASVKRNTNGPKPKEMPRRQKKISQWVCPATLLQMLAEPSRVQHKVPFFKQRST